MLFSPLSLLPLAAVASAVQITVKSNGGNATSAYQYGLMFEDINNSGDGGVYAELVQNRAFQSNEIFPSNLDFWSGINGAKLSLQNLSKPLSSALPTSMRISGGSGNVGFTNAGFWDFPVVSSWEYQGSFWMHGKYDGIIYINLESLQKKSYAAASVKVASVAGSWKEYKYTLKPTANAPNSNNTLTFTWKSNDTPLDFSLVSLFPPTYKNRENGLRIDLMEAMAGLKPSFFRAPGGNNIEGNSAPYWWNWTQTIGPLTDRPGFPGTWSYENTDGLGLLEYMLWAKDLGMEPVLAVWSGHYLDGTSIPKNQIYTYVQAALDELEFLMGDTSTTWGSRRASLGYPEPFEIHFVEVGNEDSLSDGAPTYSAYRFEAFYNAISKAYPNITIIGSYFDIDGATPPFNAAGDFHEYAIPSQMASQFGQFDNYTAEHPLLLGEYAILEYNAPGITGVTYDPGSPRAFFPFWYGSVSEAIYLLGAERNSDHIIGASYAPSFQNMNRWQWIPDMMEYDANPAHTTLSTSYHVIQLLSNTRITENLPMEGATFDPAFYVAGRSAVTGSHIFKAAVYNTTETNVPFHVTFQGVGPGAAATLTYLTAPMNASNPISGSVVEKHVQQVMAGNQAGFVFTLPPWSVAVMEIPADSCGHGYDYSSAASRQGWQTWKSWGTDATFAAKRNQWGQDWF